MHSLAMGHETFHWRLLTFNLRGKVLDAGRIPFRAALLAKINTFHPSLAKINIHEYFQAKR